MLFANDHKFHVCQATAQATTATQISLLLGSVGLQLTNIRFHLVCWCILHKWAEFRKTYNIWEESAKVNFLTAKNTILPVQLKPLLCQSPGIDSNFELNFPPFNYKKYINVLCSLYFYFIILHYSCIWPFRNMKH